MLAGTLLDFPTHERFADVQLAYLCCFHSRTAVR